MYSSYIENIEDTSWEKSSAFPRWMLRKPLQEHQSFTTRDTPRDKIVNFASFAEIDSREFEKDKW